jgi:hypothetical protein
VIKPVKLSISPGCVLRNARGGDSSIDVFVYGTLCDIKIELWKIASKVSMAIFKRCLLLLNASSILFPYNGIIIQEVLE